MQLIQSRNTAGSIVFKYKLEDLVCTNLENRDRLMDECTEENHDLCLPHLCVTSQLLLFKEVKFVFAIQILASIESNHAYSKFSLGCDHYYNPLKECLEKLGYSTDYAKQWFTVPNVDFVVLNNVALYGTLETPFTVASAFWYVIDVDLTPRERRALVRVNKPLMKYVSESFARHCV